jgi:hypothetical protein
VIQVHAREEDKHLEVVFVLGSKVFGDEEEIVEEEHLPHLALIAAHYAGSIEQKQRSSALKHPVGHHQILRRCVRVRVVVHP